MVHEWESSAMTKVLQELPQAAFAGARAGGQAPSLFPGPNTTTAKQFSSPTAPPLLPW